MADRRRFRAAGVEYVDEHAFIAVAVAIRFAALDGEAVGEKPAGENAIGERQGAVGFDAKRGDRALLAIRVVGAGAVVLRRALRVDGEEKAVLRVQLQASR